MSVRSLSRFYHLSRVVAVRRSVFVPCRFVCVTPPPFRNFSSFAENESAKKAKIEEERKESEDKRKVRRAYALGGCVIVMWLTTHTILLLRRRNEFRSLNEKVPPIGWDHFKRDYLEKGLVKSVVFQPHFDVGNVYLHSPREQAMKKSIVNLIHATPDKFSRPPDVRFILEASAKDAKKLFADSVQMANIENVQFELDEFPSYRELSFIIISSVFAVAAIFLAK
ncbi:hypothetical protein PMAYCL1PPCAC_18480 [Pristionchus mayeri]|uniref:Uncharacterized protein n=1 Tax=Pristionchus mayeri TaxID=1317129 RepID=A0AAN5I1N8_9BILA|nr:hypothetical protein PMAYCL1PPCAC_18480 [Pristionchus mayeri]